MTGAQQEGHARMSTRPIYQHPLAYLLGLQGIALMRAFAGDFDREFTHARLDEVRALLRRADELGDGWEIAPVPMGVAYDDWAPTYDGENPFFAMDEAQFLPVLDSLPPGPAIDVASGTGRYAAHLAARGHRVQGFDTSPAMLAVARAKVPEASFAMADMCRLPVADVSTGVVVNTLAMTHVEQLGAAFAEAARVLRPGGHLLVSDVRGYFLGSGRSPLLASSESHGYGYIPAWSHTTAAYLRAALDNGFLVRDCHELVAPTADRPEDEAAEPIRADEPASIWALHPWAPAAAHAARDDRISLITWHFERQ